MSAPITVAAHEADDHAFECWRCGEPLEEGATACPTCNAGELTTASRFVAADARCTCGRFLTSATSRLCSTCQLQQTFDL